MAENDPDIIDLAPVEPNPPIPPRPYQADDGARSYPRYLTAPPAGFYLVWVASAIFAAAGLVLLYGFREPILATERIRYFLVLAAALFAFSRLLLFIPAYTIGTRLKSWWVDFVLIAAAVTWRIMDPAAEHLILKIASVYILLTGAGVTARSVIRSFIDEYADRGLARPVLKLFLGSLLVAVIGGAILSLPVCWAKPVTGEKASQQAKHIIDCLFTATSSLTGTGLAVNDIQQQFTHIGQIIIVVLMQVGGFSVLLLASIAAARFHTLMGWRSAGEMSRGGLMRLIRFVFAMTILCEVAGALLLYQFWPPPAHSDEAGRILNAVFHAVSAFCNVGLTMPGDAFVGQAGPRMGIIAILSVLMLLGSLGGPVLYDLFRRDGSSRFIKPTRVTMLILAGLTLLGTGLLFSIESTPSWQLRNPRGDTPGRLRLTGAAEPIDGAIVFSSEDTALARSQRLRSMPIGERTIAAYFNTVSALGGGMPASRLDEPSLSPASRFALMTWMFIGGGLGGTAGGIRILFFYMILSAVFGKYCTPTARAIAAPTPPCPPLLRGGELMPASLVGGILLLAITSAFLLTYHEAGSFEACAFEAISATCNAGLSTGLTPQLSYESRVLLILTMLLGRVIPIGILFRSHK